MRKIIQWHEIFFPFIGGGSTHISDLITNLSSFTHDLIVDHIPGFPYKKTFANNFTVLHFPKHHIIPQSSFLEKRIISYPFRLINDIQTIHSKFRHLRKTNFDLLHVHGVAFYTAILRLNKSLNKSIYQKIVDFSFVKQPSLLTLHNFLPGFTDDKLTIDGYNHYIDQFDNVICVDKHIYDYCIEYCKEKSSDKKIWFIPNSIDTKNFYYTPLKETGKLKIGFVGRLADTVDLNMINRLLSQLPNEMEFYMAVTGDLNLIKITKSAEDRVKIFEDVSQSTMPEFYRTIDVLFSPLLIKGISRVTLEAMACGRPVIMLNRGDRFPVIDNNTGFLFKPGIDEVLSLLNEMNENRDLLARISKNARKVVESEFSNRIIIPKIKEIYESLIGGNIS